MNSITQIKTVVAGGSEGQTTAMMIAVNIDDAATAEDFVSQVAEQFKLHRKMAPPSTSMLLITLTGGLAAERFAARWKELATRDDAMRSCMSQMHVADVAQNSANGRQVSKASLLAPGTGRKPWWKFW